MIDNKELSAAFVSLGYQAKITSDLLEQVKTQTQKASGPLGKAPEDDPKVGDIATAAFEKIADLMKDLPRQFAKVQSEHQKLEKAYAFRKTKGKKK